MTIKEIAELAGVSTSTVSKIINNKDDNIKQSTRERVLDIVKKYNYIPYSSAIQSSNSKSFLIGVLLKDSEYSLQMIDGLTKSAQENGYRIVLCNSFNSEDEELKNINALQNNKIDGVIWEPVAKSSLSNSHYFSNLNIPICYINCSFADNACMIDLEKLGYEATQLLIDKNHTKIGCLTVENESCSQKILEGFKKCLYDNRMTYKNEMNLHSDIHSIFTGIFANQFTGVISSHFSQALALYKEYEKMQYRIPNDLSVVSLGDNTMDNRYYSGISCIKIPYYDFGYFLGQEITNLCEKKEALLTSFDTACILESRESLDVPFTDRTPKIIVIGSINLDITLNVDFLPQPGKTIGTNHSIVSPGGKGLNQSIAIAKLNYPVSLIGSVGNDYDSSIIYNALSENHVDINGIKHDISLETGKAYIHVQQDGESTISILSGANHALKPNDLKSKSRLFKNTSYCLIQTEIPIETVKEALKMSRAFHIQTILKPAALQSIDDSLMEYVDYFVPNFKEAGLLCPVHNSPEEMADYFLSKGAKNVIITLGDKGCFVKNKKQSFSIPAVPLTPIDTTGASDAFIATLSVYLSEGYTLQKAVKIATYAAAFCINRQGVVSALIDRNSLELYISKNEADLI